MVIVGAAMSVRCTHWQHSVVLLAMRLVDEAKLVLALI